MSTATSVWLVSHIEPKIWFFTQQRCRCGSPTLLFNCLTIISLPITSRLFSFTSFISFTRFTITSTSVIRFSDWPSPHAETKVGMGEKYLAESVWLLVSASGWLVLIWSMASDFFAPSLPRDHFIKSQLPSQHPPFLTRTRTHFWWRVQATLL